MALSILDINSVKTTRLFNGANSTVKVQLCPKIGFKMSKNAKTFDAYLVELRSLAVSFQIRARLNHKMADINS